MESVDGNCMATARGGSPTQNNNNTDSEAVTYMSVPKYELYYKMDHRKRGLAYIFNHQKFKECNERHGTIEDTRRLKRTLTDLNFEVNDFNDLNENEIQEETNSAANFDHSDYDCFLIAFLTHGDGKLLWAKNKPYQLQKILDKFNADKCRTLAGKPKIVIVQACQGTSYDPGITLISRTETDGLQRYSIPNTADFLIVYASFKGHYAFRSPENGSYFIEMLCKQLQEKGTTENILVILTLVNQRVAVDYVSNSRCEESDKKKQMPYFHCTLTRLLKFTPRLSQHP